MVSYSVQFPTMQDAQSQLQRIATQILEIGDNLRNQVTAGTAELQGDTKNAFDAVQQQYMNAHNAIQQTVQNSGVSLGQIHEQYTGTESRGVSRWAR
ncbi:WXG100 family type VII secretion target [Pseudonocardia acidicola]|jgi:WXG100 family type VII secretion target|uniref:WXG100 family type VII secretion target n=1 Tax=Pseudonocardia acidicola TaxID=2724939 RepID=A0ABX1SDQ3_9PSEU|nr:WXG100 family type VII secretion target [Pseudonocardia acidicola]NMH99699.1 WXG100 family type VII secretion target [Pseudonocardia acidicola]